MDKGTRGVELNTVHPGAVLYVRQRWAADTGMGSERGGRMEPAIDGG